MHTSVNPWTDAKALAELHACRTQDALHVEFGHLLERMWPGIEVAVAMSLGDVHRIAIVRGTRCPWFVGQDTDCSEWSDADVRSLPLTYRTHVLGKILFADDPVLGIQGEQFAAVVAHYAQALVTISLNEETRQTTEQYCASLQALEEGIVLFQEEDREAVTARLLSLSMTLGQSTAGVLYVLRTVGDTDSGLVLNQVMGIPEAMLEQFRSCDDRPWQEALVGVPGEAHLRGEDGSLGPIAAANLPDVLQNLVVVPLRYHGVEAGVIVLFNAQLDLTNSADYLGRTQSLGQLGAALLHRLQLEAHAARSRALARELQIAEAIQKRLLPTRAPATTEYDFAWCSIAAQDIGGDYLDLVDASNGDICAVIADASGHGINSALLMSSFRSTYRAACGGAAPPELAAALNAEVVNEVGSTGMFITACILRIDRNTRDVTLTSAGHTPALVYRSAANSIELLDSHGPPLGFVPDVGYESVRFRLERGDVLFLYTDGITEAADADLDMFGEDRLRDVVQRHVNGPSDELLNAAREALREFTGRDRHEDDVSLLVVKAS